MAPQKLDYHNPAHDAALRKPSGAVISLALFGAAISVVAACAAINPGLPALGVGLFGAIGLTAIGEVLGLWAAIFGTRHRRLALLGYILNAGGLIVLLWPAANGW